MTVSNNAEPGSDLFRALFESSPDAMFVESENGMVLDVNGAACVFQGISRDRLIGMAVQDLVPVEWRSKVLEDYPRWWDGSMTHFKGMSLRGDGTKIMVEVYCTRIIYKEKPAVLLHVRDLSKVAQIQQLAKNREISLNHALDQINAVIYRRNFADDTYEFLGPGIERITGYAVNELKPSIWDTMVRKTILLGGLTGNEVPAARNAYRCGKIERWQAEDLIVTRNGTDKWIHDVASLIRDPLGRPVGSTGVIIDVSDREWGTPK